MPASKAGCQRDHGLNMSGFYVHLVGSGDTMRSAVLDTATSNAPMSPASIRLLMVSPNSPASTGGQRTQRCAPYKGPLPIRREGLRPSPTTDGDCRCVFRCHGPATATHRSCPAGGAENRPTTDGDYTLNWLAEPTRHEYNPPGCNYGTRRRPTARRNRRR